MAFTSELPAQAKMLWAHVLRRAVFDYVLYKGVGKHRLEWQKAYQYIFSPGLKYDNGISFEEVCDIFGWDPDYIRRLTVQLSRSDIKRMETEAFKEEFSQNLLESCVKDMLRWKSVRCALPLYPRMVDEYTPIPTTRVVHRETLSRPVPLVRWRATV
jgi:hypothetical protein